MQRSSIDVRFNTILCLDIFLSHPLLNSGLLTPTTNWFELEKYLLLGFIADHRSILDFFVVSKDKSNEMPINILLFAGSAYQILLMFNCTVGARFTIVLFCFFSSFCFFCRFSIGCMPVSLWPMIYPNAFVVDYSAT